MIRLFHFISILFYLFSLSLSAQQIIIGSESADCNNTIDISGMHSIKATAPISSGKINEISSHKGDIYYFEKEHFTVWYSFIVEYDATLSFKITPDKPTDDYDFLLFECPTNDCCNKFVNREIIPLRTNISRVKIEKEGVTGLRNNAARKYVHEGKGNNFSSDVKVFKGHKYILILDNVYGGDGGHSIDFEFKRIAQKKRRNTVNTPMLNLNIIDEASNNMINANITIIKFDSNYVADTIMEQNNSSLFMPLISGTYYEIAVQKDKYLYMNESFRVSQDDSLLTKSIRITQADIGMSFELKNIHFRGGSANFTGNYRPILQKLYRILKENPNLKVQIQGHVNLPNGSYKRRTEEYYNQLSVARAKAVYDYLIKRGIDADRLDYQGFGYSQMVFPEAKTRDQMLKNRRVEIVVMEF